MKNLFSFFSLLSLQAQFQVNGLVTAASDGKPLVFASVIADNDTKTITDVDGFTITKVSTHSLYLTSVSLRKQ
jgi:hypothetical protein